MARALTPLYLLALFALVRSQGDSGNAAELGIIEGGNITRTTFINNGFNANRLHWPFIVPIFQLSGGGQHHICGGSIVSNYFIVTAAHCFRKQVKNPRGQVITTIDDDRRGYKVHVGDYNIASIQDGAIAVRIDRIIVHPDYKGLLNHDPYDIALIKLSQPLVYNNFVKPIPLPPLNFAFDTGTFQCHAAGWGLQSVQPRKKPDILQQLDARILHRDACRNYWGQYYNPKANMCLGNGMKATCRGDSGGPTVCKIDNNFMLAGVMSFGDEMCSGRPGVLLKVSPYVGWINKVAANSQVRG